MAKSPGAIKLDEILESLQKNKQDIPASLKDVVQEQAKVQQVNTPKQRKPRNSNQQIPEGGPVNNEHLTQPDNYPPVNMGETPPKKSEQPTQLKERKIKKKSSKIARIVLKSLLGKSLATKVLKPVKPEQSLIENKKESSYRTDIKKIKQDVEEIKAHLQLQTRNAIKPLSRMGRVGNAFKKVIGSFHAGSNAGPTNGPTNVIKSHLGINKPVMPHLEPTKPKLPDLTPDLPGMHHIPRHQTSNAVDAARTQVQEDKKNQEKVTMQATNSNDQNLVAKKNSDVAREESNKKLDDHLNKIDKDVKKQSRGFAALIPLIIAGLWKVLKPVWKIIKGGIEFIKGSIKFIKPVVTAIKNMLFDVWKGIKWITGKIGNIFKKLFGKIAGEASEVGELAGEGATAATSKLAKLGKIAKVGGKALGVAGSALDVGMGIYDLSKGKEQKELHGLDYIDPMRVGMRVGSAINSGVSKLTGGENLSDMIATGASKIMGNDKPIPVMTNHIGKIKRTAPKIVPVTNTSDKHLATATADHAATPSVTAQPIVVNAPVINAPRAKVTAQTPSIITVVNPRNPESSISRLTSILFDDPSGWASTSRL